MNVIFIKNLKIYNNGDIAYILDHEYTKHIGAIYIERILRISTKEIQVWNRYTKNLNFNKTPLVSLMCILN